MMKDLHGLNWRSLAVISLIFTGSVALNSCGKQPVDSVSTSAAPAASTSVEAKADRAVESQAQNKFADAEVKASVSKPQQPQLVKTAELSLRLESIDKTMVLLRQIVKGKQGDIYDFQDERPQDGGHRQTKLTLKVPSTVLNETLAEIAKLGRVENQSIKSEDVTTQIVDTDARLKNLRQQEDLTRKIMERSGSVRDILAVSKELSAVREQIEQLDASVKNLRQQVAYSTINLKVEEMQSATPISDAFGVQVQETWKSSTHAAGSLGTNLVLGLLWLLPFIPFMAIGAGVYYIIRRRRQVSAVESPNLEEG